MEVGVGGKPPRPVDATETTKHANTPPIRGSGNDGVLRAAA